MKYPLEDHSVFHFDVIDLLVDDIHADMLAEFPEIVGYSDSIACDTCSACFRLSTYLSCAVDIDDSVSVINGNDAVISDVVIHPAAKCDSFDSIGYDVVLQDCA